MKLPSFKRLLDKDFKEEYRSLVYELSLRLNPILDSITKVLDGKLTFGDNVQGRMVEISSISVNTSQVVTYDLTYDKPSEFTPSGVIVLSAYNISDSNSSINSAPYIIWEKSSSGIKITSIYGLIPEKNYKLKLLVI